MAGDLNRVTLIGRLVKDPELKYLQSGTAIANFTIASNRVYNTANGEKKEDVSYFDCLAWGKQGEIIVEYCKKGKRIAVEGRLQQNRWEDPDGKKRSKIEIVSENVQFLDGRGDQPTAAVSESSHEIPNDVARPVPVHAGSNDNPFSDEEIPF